MARRVQFNGRRDLPPHESLAPRPEGLLWRPGDARVFDGALAHEMGRSCGADCAGDCYAELYAATNNVGHEKQRPAPFSVHPIPTTRAAKRGKE